MTSEDLMSVFSERGISVIRKACVCECILLSEVDGCNG